MANKDAAFGFRPVRTLGGGPITSEEMNIAANYNTAIYTGQVVEVVAGGSIEASTVGETQIGGVFGGCFYTDPTTSKPTYNAYYPASTNASDIVATVYTNPNMVFEGQHDGTVNSGYDSNFANHDFVGTSGSTTTGISTSEIDTDTANAGSSGGGTFKQIGISKDPENSDTSAANVNAYVVFSTGEHIHKLITAI